MKRIVCTAVVLFTLAGAAWAGSDQGMAAYKRSDYSTALRELQPLAEQGDAGSQLYLGFMYSNGQGVAQNYAEAVRWYRKAAKQGHAKSQNYLGIMYEEGAGVTRDYTEAARWYRMAAEQGIRTGSARDFADIYAMTRRNVYGRFLTGF